MHSLGSSTAGAKVDKFDIASSGILKQYILRLIIKGGGGGGGAKKFKTQERGVYKKKKNQKIKI